MHLDLTMIAAKKGISLYELIQNALIREYPQLKRMNQAKVKNHGPIVYDAIFRRAKRGTPGTKAIMCRIFLVFDPAKWYYRKHQKIILYQKGPKTIRYKLF